MTPPDSPRRLGRGLGALLAPASSVQAQDVATATPIQRIPIADIQANPFQPRRSFDPAELESLAASLKASGLLQPIAVRLAKTAAPAAGSTGRPVRYELLAGERRLRAATHLGWPDIPAVIKEADDRTALTLALVENLQRSDLNPIEEAEGYAQLVQGFSLTQQEVADAVGKDRSTVANTLRLLSLPPAVRAMVRDGQLSVGHARALLALESAQDMLSVARDAVSRELTVRELEAISHDSHKPVKRRKRGTKAGRRLDSHGKEIEDRLRRYFQTDVRLSLSARDRGQLSILFYSNEDLERVLELILGRTGDGL